MSLDPSRTPVLVGIGQSIERDGIASAIELAERAAEAALEDAPGLREKIQRVSVVAISFSPVSLAPATELASALGLGDVECEVTTPGGNSPQWLVSRACEPRIGPFARDSERFVIRLLIGGTEKPR